jgi:peptide/nickel transport system permease protein
MLRFLTRRLAAMLLTMLVVSFLVFFIAEVVPVDPARAALGPFAKPEAIEALREEMGLNRPVLVRYGNWLLGCLRGDMGVSIHFRRPVSELVKVRLGRSLELAALGFLFMIPMGLALGTLAGVAEGKYLDRIISISSSLMVSLPSYVSGVLVIIVFSLWLGWLPGTSIPDPEAGFLQGVRKLILPILALSLDEIGYLARLTRSNMGEVLRKPYIRTAQLKGLPRTTVIMRHALRNALIAPFTAITVHINWLIGGVVVVEVLFRYPGMGSLVLDAAMRNDVVLLEGATLVLTLVAVVSQVLADLGYYLLNPRIRVG